MTQMKEALKGRVTPEMEGVAEDEGIAPQVIRKKVAAGRAVIPGNVHRSGTKSVGIGEGLKVKVNANIGTSADCPSMEAELEKARVAIEAGAHTIMDLSTGGDLGAIRKEMLKLGVPLGTVPIYEAGVRMVRAGKKIVDMDKDDLMGVIEEQAKEGVDFMTLHCGITLEALEKLQRQGRLTGIVSRGGSFLAAWMLHHKAENPLYDHYDYLLEVAAEHDVTLSLGDALRPGSGADATDRAQLQELIILGELVDRSREKGVQCMVEGPGHLPMNEIEANVLLEKKLCKGAPFYVLGPLVTDVAPGWDHITGAIGGAMAAYAGADFLCYVTPSEHLALPTTEDVKRGVIASRIAAHAADLARGKDTDWDGEMSKARASLDWERQFELCLDPETARAYRQKRHPQDPKVCTMCGEFCAMKLLKDLEG